MEAELLRIGLGFLAGVLSLLSPCVLPLLPIVLASASSGHRWGAPALAAGLVVSFVSVGLFVATIGFSIGLDAGVFRFGSGVLLALLGLVLLIEPLQARVAAAAGAVSDTGNRIVGRFAPQGLAGQFILGVLMGAIWSPCVGPTLGAASVLAAQGKDLGQVAAVMVAFGLGVALPLVAIGLASREALARWRGRFLNAGKAGRMVLGGGALAVAALILSGLDRQLETWLVTISPAWLTELTTRF